MKKELRMDSQFSRSEIVFGKNATEILQQKKVAVFGLGGVGGSACEALARSGIGHFMLIDADVFSLSNINRQSLADHTTIGRKKTEVMEERIHRINPNATVETLNIFYLPENASLVDLSRFDYVLDAIDTVKAKIDIITRAKELSVPIISSLGCGNRVDPTKIKICDLYETTYDKLGRVLRKLLRKKGVTRLTVVCSEEKPVLPEYDDETQEERKTVGDRTHPVPGSTSFVPPAAGLAMASYVVRELIGYVPVVR